MKVHKLTVMVIDHDEVGADEAKHVIETARYPNRCIMPHVMNVETANIGEWREDHPLNQIPEQEAEFERLFPKIAVYANKEQKLVDIMFDVAMTIRKHDSLKNKTQEELAAWVAEQLRNCGFPTTPVGASWGMLDKKKKD